MSVAIDPRDRLLTAKRAARLCCMSVRRFKEHAETSPALIDGTRWDGPRMRFVASNVVRFFKVELPRERPVPLVGIVRDQAARRAS